LIKVTVVKNSFCPNLLVTPRRPGAGILFYNKEKSKRKKPIIEDTPNIHHTTPFRNVCLKHLLGVLSGKKITVPPYVVTAISFFKEAAFAASPNPSSILLGIHFCIYSSVHTISPLPIFPKNGKITAMSERTAILPSKSCVSHDSLSLSLL